MNRPLFPTTLSIPSYDIGKWVGLRTYQQPLVEISCVEFHIKNSNQYFSPGHPTYQEGQTTTKQGMEMQTTKHPQIKIRRHLICQNHNQLRKKAISSYLCRTTENLIHTHARTYVRTCVCVCVCFCVRARHLLKIRSRKTCVCIPMRKEIMHIET